MSIAVKTDGASGARKNGRRLLMLSGNTCMADGTEIPTCAVMDLDVRWYLYEST